jgi:predicted secreted Zn-dependent protease
MKGQRYATAAIAIFAVLLAASAYASPSLTERNDDYAITGRTAAELRAQMERLGPRNADDGKIYAANAHTELQWRYQYQTDLEGCRIASADIRMVVVYTMPAWSDYDSAPRDVRDSWDRYRARLTIHEQGHRDIGMQVAAELERELLETRRRYCDELGTAAEETARGKLQVLKERHRAYDDRTRHGATEGAVFP